MGRDATPGSTRVVVARRHHLPGLSPLVVQQQRRRGGGHRWRHHTSDQHPWFLDSRRFRASRHRDYYVWRRPGPGGAPPNNWIGYFGQPAWWSTKTVPPTLTTPRLYSYARADERDGEHD